MGKPHPFYATPVNYTFKCNTYMMKKSIIFMMLLIKSGSCEWTRSEAKGERNSGAGLLVS